MHQHQDMRNGNGIDLNCTHESCESDHALSLLKCVHAMKNLIIFS